VLQYKLRAVHVLLIATLIFFYQKVKYFIYVNDVLLSPFEGEILSPDLKLKKYHAQRDMAITLTSLMCWLYVCGFAKLMGRVDELKEKAHEVQQSNQAQQRRPQANQAN